MTRASTRLLVRFYKANLRQKGFMLMELVVSIALITVIGYLSSEILISSFRSERQLRDKTMLTDQADYLKTWLSAKLQQADTPLPCPAGTGTGCTELPAGAPGNKFNSLEFVSSNYCYVLQLDQSDGTIAAGQSQHFVSDGINQACSEAQTEANSKDNVIAQYATNDSNNKLFIFKSDQGNVLDVDNDPSQISNATTVEVDPIFDRTDGTAKAFNRDMTFNLGGAFVPGTPPDGSITQNKIATDAVTNTKIADGSVTSSKIQAGAVTADKLDTGSKTTYFNVPLMVGNTSQWTLSDGSFDPSPTGNAPDSANTPAAYLRAGLMMMDYCVPNKTLQGRLLFSVKGNGGAMTLTGQITQVDGSGTTQTNGPFPITMSSPGSIPAGTIASLASSWATIDSGTCTAPWLSTTYYYQPQLQGTQGQPFVLVSAILQLRYQ
jgi:hypothetical protein